MKKKRKLQMFENVVVFPGVVEKLLADAHQYAEHFQYERANEHFEEALQYIEADEATLSVYAYSLYEVKRFERAKEVCEQLLALKPIMYFEAMELYLTVCMQLKQFQQVEKMIASLLAEGLVPAEQLEKFQRLQQLNADIAENKRQQEVMEAETEELDVSAADFLAKRPEEQLLFVHELTQINIRPIADILVEIVEHEQTHPFIKSLVLILLVEQEMNRTLTIQKFGQTATINPSELALPTKMPQFQAITAGVIEQLEQEPSTLELVQYLLAKHAIVTYPFEWLDYTSETVATSYIQYVRAMFGTNGEVDEALEAFIIQLEKWTELQDM